MSKLYTAVIVDDNQSLSYMVRDGINQSENFDVVGIAHNGDEGIKLIEALTPDIVILDIIMPKTDGLTVLEHFKDRKNMEFIILSAIGHDLVTRRAVSLGAMFYLIKPFEIDTLITRMESLILGKDKSETESVLNDDFIKRLISDEISMLGVPMHIKGYVYINDAIAMTVAADLDSLKITKSIYPSVAELHSTTPTSVERAIRNAIELTVTRGDDSFLKEYFNHEFYNNKITNKEFIVRIAENVKNKA
jgi:two-component system response regulator (stage 0 sporulation protein A)